MKLIYAVSAHGKPGRSSSAGFTTNDSADRKAWFCEEMNTLDRNVVKVLCFEYCTTLSLQVSIKGFDLSKLKTLIYIAVRRQEKGETLCSDPNESSYGEENKFPAEEISLV